MRFLLCRVFSLRCVLATTLLMSVSGAWAGKSTPPPALILAPSQFIQAVGLLEAHPMDIKTQHTVSGLINWVNAHHPLSASESICPAMAPLVAEAQTGEDAASQLYIQTQLELVAYQLLHPQASAFEAQAAALSNTLRMYLAMRAQGLKTPNFFAEDALADIRTRGNAALLTHTCAGTKVTAAVASVAVSPVVGK